MKKSIEAVAQVAASTLVSSCSMVTSTSRR
jgi:hypothetical protein